MPANLKTLQEYTNITPRAFKRILALDPEARDMLMLWNRLKMLKTRTDGKVLALGHMHWGIPLVSCGFRMTSLAIGLKPALGRL